MNLKEKKLSRSAHGAMTNNASAKQEVNDVKNN